jgi:23S rRNA (cytidine1920-2'-O)/16S rRNA (cytidine1409-2'-O)-methyltransferase
VVNLEGINVSHLSHHPLADRVDVVTIDVSYLSLTRAVAQLPLTAFTAGADLVGLVKPMFELARGQLPTAPHDLQAAATAAADGVARAGWRVVSTIQSPTLGARGAIEFFVHARLP